MTAQRVRDDPAFGRLNARSLLLAINRGWEIFVSTRTVSVSYAMIFAVIGVLILIGIERASFVPMIFPFVGGFMLVGPLLLSGFFSLADRDAKGETCSIADIVGGISRTSREMLVIALVCTLLFMVWITDAATLYGFMVGRTPETLTSLLAPNQNVLAFLSWTSLLGALLAMIIFAVSAFSVPLLYYRRAGMVTAVYLSVAAVLSNFSVCMIWALILSVTIIASIVIFPTFLLTFPVLSFASHALYRELFPD